MKRESDLSLFLEDQVVHVENPKEHIDILLEFGSKFNTLLHTKLCANNKLHFCIILRNRKFALKI